MLCPEGKVPQEVQYFGGGGRTICVTPGSLMNQAASAWGQVRPGVTSVRPGISVPPTRPGSGWLSTLSEMVQKPCGLVPDGKLKWEGGDDLGKKGCQRTGKFHAVGRSRPEYEYCCPPAGTCPPGMTKKTGSTCDDMAPAASRRYQEMDISVHCYPTYECEATPGYVPSVPSTVPGSPGVVALSPRERPFYKHPLFLVGAGVLGAYVLIKVVK